MKYMIRDKEAGNEIAVFATMAEAQAELAAYEEQDKAEDTFEENFYEIVEVADSVDRIRKLRRQTGMSQRAFAEYFGIPARTIQNWEYGVNEAPDYLLDLIEDKLNQTAPKMHLSITYKNGNTIEDDVNYLHEEDGKLCYTAANSPHGIFQDIVKIPMENIDHFDLVQL